MNRIDILKKIAASGKAFKLDGHTVDKFTAARVLETYKGLDAKSKAKFAALTVDKMAEVEKTADNSQYDAAFFSACAGRLDSANDIIGDVLKEFDNALRVTHRDDDLWKFIRDIKRDLHNAKSQMSHISYKLDRQDY